MSEIPSSEEVSVVVRMEEEVKRDNGDTESSINTELGITDESSRQDKVTRPLVYNSPIELVKGTDSLGEELSGSNEETSDIAELFSESNTDKSDSVQVSCDKNKEGIIDDEKRKKIPLATENTKQKKCKKSMDGLSENEIVIYPHRFECSMCNETFSEFNGIMLIGCSHVFCVECITDAATSSEDAEMKCPYKNNYHSCQSKVQEHEIQALLGEVQYSKRLKRIVQVAESKSNSEIVEVPAENKQENIIEKNTKDEKMYKDLLDLQQDNIVLYPQDFECPICLESYGGFEGIILKECLHIFCLQCIRQTAKSSEDIDVKCPFRDNEYSCPSNIQENEIQSLFTAEEYSQRLKRTLKVAETAFEFKFHCQKPDCDWWFDNEEGLQFVDCPVCLLTNCTQCRGIHPGISCDQYGEVRNPGSNVRKSEAALAEMVQSGKAMYCPKCTAVVQKEYGCDALTCTICRTVLCWATKGPRWGPNGQGDNSAGCRCNFNGVKCHYNCQNCH